MELITAIGIALMGAILWVATNFNVIRVGKGVKADAHVTIVNATAGLEKVMTSHLEDMDGTIEKKLAVMEAKIDKKLAEIEFPDIPKLPEDLDKTLAEIYEAIPGQEDWDAVTATVTEALLTQLASMEGVKQKALYDWMNKNEKAFGMLDEEAQMAAISTMDLTSMALQELASIKMSPTQAKKTPFMAAGLNIGKVAMAQIVGNLKNEAMAPGRGRVSIEGAHSSYNPGFNP